MKKLLILFISILFITLNLSAEATISAYIPKWTVMFYMTPSPDIEDDMINNIIELTEVGDDWDLNIVLQVDWSKSKPSSDKREYFPDPYYTGVSRYAIGRKGKIELIKHLGEKNMGDVNTLWDFLDYCRKYEEGRKYILVFAGHGSGFEAYNDLDIPLHSKSLKTYTKKSAEYPVALNINNRSIAYDDIEGDSLTIFELKKAFDLFKAKTGRKIDVLVFDSCLLLSLETAYELRNSVKYIVGSEAGVLTKGVDYSSIIRPIKENPNISTEQEINKICYAFVGGDGWTSTLANMFGGAVSAGFKASKIVNIKNALDNLLNEIFKVKKHPIEFYDLIGFGKTVRYYDINRWCYKIMTRYVNFPYDPNYKNVALAAKKLSNAIAYANVSLWTAGKYNRSMLGGIAIWWPDEKWYKQFRNQLLKTSLAKDSKWDEFLDRFVLGTTKYSFISKVNELKNLNNSVKYYSTRNYSDNYIRLMLEKRDNLVKDLENIYDLSDENDKKYIKNYVKHLDSGFEELKEAIK